MMIQLFDNNKELLRKLRSYVLSVLNTSTSITIDKSDIGWFECIVHVLEQFLKLKILKIKLVNFKKESFVEKPDVVIAVSSGRINKERFERGVLCTTFSSPCSIKGKAILFYSTHVTLYDIEGSPLPSKSESANALMRFNEIVSKRGYITTKITFENDTAKIVILSGSSFEVFEGHDPEEKIAKAKAAEQALNLSVLLKLPKFIVKKYNPVSDLNEISLANKIKAKYEYDKSTKTTVLHLTKHTKSGYYFESYTATGKDKKDSNKNAASLALRKSVFLTYAIPQEKFEPIQNTLELILKNPAVSEDDKIDAIVEYSQYVPIVSHYDHHVLRKIKRAQYIDRDEFMKLNQQQRDEHDKRVEQEVERIKAGYIPQERTEYYKMLEKEEEDNYDEPEEKQTPKDIVVPEESYIIDMSSDDDYDDEE